MIIYLAASFPNKEKLRTVNKYLLNRGVKVICRWLDNKLYGLNKKDAIQDYEDVESSDVIIVFSDGGQQLSKGGRHTILGLALGWKKKIYLFGPKEQLFHYHPSVNQVTDRLLKDIDIDKLVIKIVELTTRS